MSAHDVIRARAEALAFELLSRGVSTRCVELAVHDLTRTDPLERHDDGCACALCLALDAEFARGARMPIDVDVDPSYHPPWRLRRMVSRYSYLEPICQLPYERRRWFFIGERGRWFRENVCGFLADDEWDDLVRERG